MQYFAGLSTTDYQDVLRAIGRWLDESGLRFIRLMEVDDGIVVQGISVAPLSEHERRVETRLFTDADVHDILVAAYHRRQREVEALATAARAGATGS